MIAAGLDEMAEKLTGVCTLSFGATSGLTKVRRSYWWEMSRMTFYLTLVRWDYVRPGRSCFILLTFKFTIRRDVGFEHMAEASKEKVYP
jgi:hypothetical protein